MRAGHVALDGDPTVHLDTPGGRHADDVAAGFHDMREHARGRGLTVGAGDRGHRDATRRARRVEHVEHLAGNVARLAFARRNVHTKAGAGVDLDYGAADVLVGHGDIVGDEIDATDVETDRAYRAHRHFTIVRVHHVGQIDRGAAGRQVGGGSQEKDLVFFQYGVFIVAGIFHQTLRLFVEFDASQYLFVADTAARIGIDDIDQLLDRELAVADHVTGHALGDRDQFVVDHQHAMVVTGNETFCQHVTRPALLARYIESLANFFVAVQVDADAAAMIGIERLDHNRITNALAGLDCLVLHC